MNRHHRQKNLCIIYGNSMDPPVAVRGTLIQARIHGHIFGSIP